MSFMKSRRLTSLFWTMLGDLCQLYHQHIFSKPNTGTWYMLKWPWSQSNVHVDPTHGLLGFVF